MKFNKNEAKPTVPSSRTTGIGGNILLDGPLELNDFPKEKGSSSGKNAMKLKLMYPDYNGLPITKRAKIK
jgi:hypothetical protein